MENFGGRKLSVSSNENEARKCFVKLVVIGDSGVGKSSLIHFF